RVRGRKLPIAGAISSLEAAGADIVPILWCMATPSAHVTRDAFERITTELLDLIKAAGPLDGICLELHGAMVAEHVDDGEGELLARLRRQVGPDTPISVSLDLHANVTRAMVDNSDFIDMYRYYPHTDMVEAGARAAAGLVRILRTGKRPAKAFRQLDFLIPINGGCTDFGVAREVYLTLMPEIERASPGLVGLSFASGFPHADFADCGPSVIAYAETQAVADAAADRLATEVRRRESQFLPEFYSAVDAVDRALTIARTATKPVVIADTQDNPGGGGPGDTTGVLRALVAAGVRGAAIGAIIDPETAAEAHQVGEGGVSDFAIGGKRLPGDQPLEVRARVRRARSDGWTASGAMKGGMPVDLGLTALLEIEPEGVLVAVASKPSQTLDAGIFRHLGLIPEQLPVIVVKSSVHFRADFTPMASAIIVAKAPGPVAIDHTELPYKKLRPGLRLMPKKA
ncbi:MAG: M81 family metallopeptidase, partial [Proteobacteria bacterium]|nr:M81 family metallopeptidase [Pseudomonadota bacterium]